jgi:hypothetical protein
MLVRLKVIYNFHGRLLPAPDTAVFGLLSTLRAHTKAPYKMDLHRKMLRNAKGA